jgi:hypothetical protein
VGWGGLGGLPGVRCGRLAARLPRLCRCHSAPRPHGPAPPPSPATPTPPHPSYNALQTHDLYVALSSVARRFPEAPLFAVGYSLGSVRPRAAGAGSRGLLTPAHRATTASWMRRARLGHAALTLPPLWPPSGLPPPQVLLAKYLAEADAGLHGPSPALHGAAPPAAAAAAGAAPGWGGSVKAAAAAGGNRWAGLSGSGLVAAALVSAPVCLHCTNAKLARPSPDMLYNLAVAYK